MYSTDSSKSYQEFLSMNDFAVLLCNHVMGMSKNFDVVADRYNAECLREKAMIFYETVKTRRDFLDLHADENRIVVFTLHIVLMKKLT